MSRYGDSDTDQTESRVPDISRRGFLQSSSVVVGSSLLSACQADEPGTNTPSVSPDNPANVSINDSGNITAISVSDPVENQSSVTVELPSLSFAESDPRCHDSTVTITGYDPLTLDVNFTDEPDEARTVTFGADYCTFVDPCEDFSKLDDQSDTGSLEIDTADQKHFDRPDGTTDGAKISRDGTTADTEVVYEPPGIVANIAVEFHWFKLEDGSLDIYESTDGGSSWTQVSQSVTEYSSSDSSNWINELHEYSSFSEGTDKVKLVVTGGNKHWTGQIGHVEIDYEA